MISYTIKRILWMIPTLLVVAFIVFALSNFMPGDPVLGLLNSDYTQEEYDAMEARLGLDKPFFPRFVNYIWGIISKFDFGVSYSTTRSVTTEINERIWVTFRLGLISCIISISLAILVGVVSATHQYSALDYIVTTATIFFASAPGFWIALMLLLLFCLKLNWLPATGLSSWKHYILPVTCNAISPIAMTARMTRSSMLECIRSDYVKTARAKGLPERKVIYKHALGNALIPIVTMAGGQFGQLVGGSVIIESIFTIPGMGSYMVTGINGRDYPVIMGTTILISAFTCCLNLLIDLAYAAIDPRIKAQFAGNKIKKEKPEKKTEEAAA